MSIRPTNQEKTLELAVCEVITAELGKSTVRQIQSRLGETRMTEDEPVTEVLQRILPKSYVVYGVEVTFKLIDPTSLIPHLGVKTEEKREGLEDTISTGKPRSDALYPQYTD